jgi:hypothetical protein
MNSRIPQNHEALSAYLDNQLGGRERSQLEARLRADPALRAELETLRRTRAILRATPQVRAPRNFTLTPEMAAQLRQQPRQSGLFFVFRYAFVLSSLLFVLALAGNFLLPGALERAFGAPQGEITALQEEMADAARNAGESEQTQSLAVEETVPAAGDTAPVEEPPAEFQPETYTEPSATAEPTATPEPTATAELPDQPGATSVPGIQPAATSPTAAAPGDAPQPPTAEPTATPEPTALPTEPPPAHITESIESLPADNGDGAGTAGGADPSGEEPAPAEPVSEPVEPDQGEPAGYTLFNWRDALILLGALALITGGLSLLLKRR